MGGGWDGLVGTLPSCSARARYRAVLAPAAVIVGTAGANRLEGSDARDTMRGIRGDDGLLNSNGADQLDGGPCVDCAGSSAALRQATDIWGSNFISVHRSPTCCAGRTGLTILQVAGGERV